MRVVVLCADDRPQSLLLTRVAEQHTLAGVVVDRRYGPADRLGRLWQSSGRRPLRVAANVLRKMYMAPETRRETRVKHAHFGALPLPSRWPHSPMRVTPELNAPATAAWVTDRQPDLIVVFGTRLIKPPLDALAPQGTINLHTGLSPYYRGGHSTFFALLNAEPQFIGATVHRLDPGIDSGAILRSDRPTLAPDDTLYSLECKVTCVGIDLVMETLSRLARGNCPGVPQWTPGRLYYSRDYTLDRRITLKHRLERGWLAQWIAEHPGGPEAVRLIP